MIIISRRQLIIKNAIELFAEKGYISTSIQEITEKCGISKGAFYLSFKSKDELILAIFDDVIAQFSENVDQVVNSMDEVENKLFQYYYSIFNFLNCHRNFARLFVFEQMHHPSQWQSVNKKIFDKVSFYDHQFSYTVLSLLDQLYGERIAPIKYDMMACIKALIKTFGEYVLLQHDSADIHALAKTLVDKTNALAYHTTTAYLTETSFQSLRLCFKTDISIDSVIEQIESRIANSKDPIEHESLQLLLTQLQSDQPSYAIIQGMLNNLKAYDGARPIISMMQQIEYQQKNS